MQLTLGSLVSIGATHVSLVLRLIYINSLKIAQKLLYHLSRFALIIALIFPVISCINRYLEEGTYIDTVIVPQRNALFPDTTICPVNSMAGYKHKELQVLHLYFLNKILLYFKF